MGDPLHGAVERSAGRSRPEQRDDNLQMNRLQDEYAIQRTVSGACHHNQSLVRSYGVVFYRIAHASASQKSNVADDPHETVPYSSRKRSCVVHYCSKWPCKRAAFVPCMSAPCRWKEEVQNEEKTSAQSSPGTSDEATLHFVKINATPVEASHA